MIQNFKKLIKTGLIILVVFTISQNDSYAQLGGRLNKMIKNKATKNKTTDNQTTESETTNEKGKHEPDQGITNETHRTNIGKIVWANEIIDMDNPDPSKFKDHFSAKEQICGRFYLAQSIENSIIDEIGKSYGEYNYYYDVYVDGKIIEWKMDNGRNYGESLHRTTQQVVVFDDREFCDRPGWTKLVNSLQPGEHEIKVDLRAEYSGGTLANTIFVSGSFKLTKNAGDIIKIGKSYSTIEAGMVNKEIESGILSSIQNYAKSQAWSEKFNKVKIQSKDWDIVRNKYSGVIIGRTVTAYCFASWPDGHCTLQRFVFIQEYNGSSYSKVLKYRGLISSSQEKVDCE